MSKQNPKKPINRKNNKKGKKTRFSITWLYIIIAVVLGWMYFNGEGGVASAEDIKQATYSEFKQYVDKGYASRIEVMKDQGSLRMYVKGEHIRDVFPKHKKGSTVEPYVVVEFGSVDKLEDFIDQKQQEQKFQGELKYKEQSNTFWQILINFGPFLL
jgi:cell division protease FtsH